MKSVDPVAVITGGASGIGAAAAVEFARCGVDSVVTYLPSDPHRVDDTVRSVHAVGRRCVPVAADVTDSAEVERAFDTAIDVFGRIDAAVAGAGILREAPLQTMTDVDWDAMMAVDLKGVMATFRSAVHRMTDGGALIAIASLAGARFGWSHHAHYCAAKAGLVGLCRALALELGPRSIRVNCVIPGFIESPQSLDPVNSLGAERLAATADIIPAGRVGTPRDVAALIRFLAGDDATYITGQELVVDGGLSVKFPA